MASEAAKLGEYFDGIAKKRGIKQTSGALGCYKTYFTPPLAL
jgi:hypothetical protein